MGALALRRVTIGALALALTASLAAPCLSAAPAASRDEPCTMAGHASHGSFAEACCLADEAQRNDREAQPISRITIAAAAQIIADAPVAAAAVAPTQPMASTAGLASVLLDDTPARSAPLRI